MLNTVTQESYCGSGSAVLSSGSTSSIYGMIAPDAVIPQHQVNTYTCIVVTSRWRHRRSTDHSRWFWECVKVQLARKNDATKIATLWKHRKAREVGDGQQYQLNLEIISVSVVQCMRDVGLLQCQCNAMKFCELANRAFAADNTLYCSLLTCVKC